jgi:hypothetical protein
VAQVERLERIQVVTVGLEAHQVSARIVVLRVEVVVLGLLAVQVIPLLVGQAQAVILICPAGLE